MNTKIHIAIVGGLLLGGCISSEDQTDIEIVDELDEPTVPTGDPADELASVPEESVPAAQPIIPPECIGAAVVAILEDPESSCVGHRDHPPVGWVWNPMFVSGSPEVSALTLPVPQEFEKFCKFEYVGQAKPGPETYAPILAYIDAHPALSLDTTAADCLGFAAQAPTTLADPELRKLLSESFMMNVDAPEDNELEDTLGSQTPVRLEVIDSVSQTAVDNHLTPANAHGEFMSALIGGIACPNDTHDCLSQNRHLLAMPREDYHLPDWTVGKKYGSKVDLAVQIYAAVQQWRQDKLNHQSDLTHRLVLNISLGYDRVNAGLDDFNRGPQASLKMALDFASCHGALVFVASGNVRDENCPQNESGPLAPAAFEEIQAPTQDDCHALGFMPDWDHDFPVFGDKRPLVYAVGGVDAYDEPLPNSRQHSQPELVALGAAAIGNDMTIPLTGTSVSAAVASATAKLLWMYNPRLLPEEVFEIMYKSGWDLGKQADFGYWPGANTSRISVCAALSSMCQDLDPHECPHLHCEAQPAAYDGNLGGFFSAVDDVLHNPSTVLKEYDGHAAAPVCDVWQPTELVNPQPELPICAHCGADVYSGPNNDKLHMSVDPVYQGQITNVVFLLKDISGISHAVTMDAEVIASLNDPTIGVVDVLFSAPFNTKSGTLSFTLTTGSQSNPVVLRYVN